MKNSNEIRSAATIATKSTKVRPKVPCHCKKCNSKLDDKEKTSNKAPSDSKKHSRSVPIGIKTIVAASSQNACDDNIVMINDNHDQNVATSSQSLHDGDIVMIDDNNDRSDEDFHNQNPTNF
ncbi:3679_t:CDS:2 [Rhizophagus irregularis]|nr:3679_t:CDS:2 [Rhizophagus irregularis]